MQKLLEIDFTSNNNDPEGEIESVRDSVISEKECDKSSNDKEKAKVNLKSLSSRLENESPLNTFIENFKQKHNISVEPNDFAIFV
jgi:hypothetical protein